MTASPYASDAKIAEALAVIEAENVGTRKQTILQQILVACALGGGNILANGPFTAKIWNDLTTWNDATYWID